MKVTDKGMDAQLSFEAEGEIVSLIGAMTRIVPGGPWLPVWGDLQTPILKTGLALVRTGAGALLLGRFRPRSRLFGKIALTAANSASAGYTAAPDSSSWIGKAGVTLTQLHPAGVARIDGQRLDVVTSGEFIDTGIPVKIVEARGSRLVVQRT